MGWDREWFNIDTRYSWNRAKSCTVQHTKIWLTFWSLFGIYTSFAMLKIMNFKFLSLKTPCICRAKLQILMFLYTLPHIPVALSEYTVFTCILQFSVHILLSHASLGLKCKHCIKMRGSVKRAVKRIWRNRVGACITSVVHTNCLSIFLDCCITLCHLQPQ